MTVLKGKLLVPYEAQENMIFRLLDGTELVITKEDASGIANKIIIEYLCDPGKRENVYIQCGGAFDRAKHIYDFYQHHKSEMSDEIKEKYFVSFLDACNDKNNYYEPFERIMKRADSK